MEVQTWIRRLERLDYNLEKAVEALKNDRTCTSIEAALVMTVGFAGLMYTPSRYTDQTNYLVPITYAISAFSALLSVYTGSVEYLCINLYRSEDFLICVQKIGSRIVVPYLYMQISVFSLVIAGVFTVFANVDLNCGIAVTALAGLTVLLAIWHGLLLADGI